MAKQIYRARPEFVEALQLTQKTAQEIADWCGGVVIEEIDPTDSTKRYVGVNIPTMMGVIRAQEGMFVLRNNRNEFKIMPEREFAGKYELS
jgi:hypothetical protein